ncbi:hypothetical protein JCM8202_004409 [Rhodotorula sphaerocarpa]
MPDQAVPVAFDVLGTCFDLRAAADPLRNACPTLKDAAPGLVNAVIDDWFHSTQRDFTYLSMNGSYTPMAEVFKASLPRTLAMQGLLPERPEPFTSPDHYSDLLQPVLGSIKTLPARPGLGAASAKLHQHGFRTMGATNGGLETTRGLFVNAFGEETAQRWDFYSCDEDQIAKPAPPVYAAIRKRLGLQPGDECWFVAAHTWDLLAAKKAGFKTALVTYEEHFVLEHLFGRPDVVAPNLEILAEQIIAKTRQ